MNGRPTAAAAGKIDVGGDVTANRLGSGAMRITGPGVWGDPPDRERAIQAPRRAVALDVTFIDTADSHGPEVSERLIAEALYPYPEELVIATKGGLIRPGPRQWVPDGRLEHLRRACEGSLARLRLDRIDLYQFHRPGPKVPIAESIGALAELKDEGKIRHIGVSNVTEDQFREAERVAAVVSVQNRYNVADRSSEPMLDLCDLEMVVFIPWAPTPVLHDPDPMRIVRREGGTITPDGGPLTTAAYHRARQWRQQWLALFEPALPGPAIPAVIGPDGAVHAGLDALRCLAGIAGPGALSWRAAPARSAMHVSRPES